MAHQNIEGAIMAPKLQHFTGHYYALGHQLKKKDGLKSTKQGCKIIIVHKQIRLDH